MKQRSYEITWKDGSKPKVEIIEKVENKDIYEKPREKLIQVKLNDMENLDLKIRNLRDHFNNIQNFKNQKTAFKCLLFNYIDNSNILDTIRKFYLDNYDYSKQIIFLIEHVDNKEKNKKFINFILDTINNDAFSFKTIKSEDLYETTSQKTHFLNILTILFNKSYFDEQYENKLSLCFKRNNILEEINSIICNNFSNSKGSDNKKILHLYLFFYYFYSKKQQDEEPLKTLMDNIQKKSLSSNASEINSFYMIVKYYFIRNNQNKIKEYFDIIQSNTKKHLLLEIEGQNDTEVNSIINYLNKDKQPLTQIYTDNKAELVFIEPDEKNKSCYYIKKEIEISPYNGFTIFQVNKILMELIKVFAWKNNTFEYDIEFLIDNLIKKDINESMYSKIKENEHINKIIQFYMKNTINDYLQKNKDEIKSNQYLHNIITDIGKKSFNECYVFLDNMNLIELLSTNPQLQSTIENDIIHKQTIKINKDIPHYDNKSYIPIIKQNIQNNKKLQNIYHTFVDKIENKEESPEKELKQTIESNTKILPSFVNDIEQSDQDILQLITNNPNIYTPYIVGLIKYIREFQVKPLQFKNNQQVLIFYELLGQYSQNTQSINMLHNLSNALNINSTEIPLENNNDKYEITFNKGFNLYLEKTLDQYLSADSLNSLAKIKEIAFLVDSICRNVRIYPHKRYHLLSIYAYISNVKDINNETVRALISNALILNDDLYDNLQTYGINVSQNNENEIQLNNDILNQCTDQWKYLGELFYVLMKQYKNYDTRVALLKIIFSSTIKNYYYFKNVAILLANEIINLDCLTDEKQERSLNNFFYENESDKNFIKLNEIIINNKQLKNKILLIQGIEVFIQDYYLSSLECDFRNFSTDHILEYITVIIKYLQSFNSFSSENTYQTLFCISFIKIYFSLYLQQITNTETVLNCSNVETLLSDNLKTKDMKSKLGWILIAIYILKLLRYSLPSFYDFRVFNFINSQMMWTQDLKFGEVILKYEFPFLSNLDNSEHSGEEYEQLYGELLTIFKSLQSVHFRTSEYNDIIKQFLQSDNMDMFVDIVFNLIICNFCEPEYTTKMEHIELGSWSQDIFKKIFDKESELHKYFRIITSKDLFDILIKDEKSVIKLNEIEICLITYKVVFGLLYAKNQCENIFEIIKNNQIILSDIKEVDKLILYFVLNGIKDYTLKRKPTKSIEVYSNIVKELHLKGINNEKLYFNILYVQLKESCLKEKIKVLRFNDIEQLLQNIINHSIEKYSKNSSKYSNYIYNKINYKNEIIRNLLIEQKSEKLYKEFKLLQIKNNKNRELESSVFPLDKIEECSQYKCLTYYCINEKILILMELMYLKIYPSFDQFKKEFNQIENKEKKYPLINYFIQKNIGNNNSFIQYDEVKKIIDLYKGADNGVIKVNNNMKCMLNEIEDKEINVDYYLIDNLDYLIYVYGNSMSLKRETPNLCCGDLIEFDFDRIELELSKILLPLVNSK